MKTGIQKKQTYNLQLYLQLTTIKPFPRINWWQVASPRQVTISEPLQFDHYGGLEYAAEVALLSRSVRFQGVGIPKNPEQNAESPMVLAKITGILP